MPLVVVAVVITLIARIKSGVSGAGIPSSNWKGGVYNINVFGNGDDTVMNQPVGDCISQ